VNDDEDDGPPGDQRTTSVRGVKRGTTRRLAAEAIQQAGITGQLPHEILLSMARGEVQKVPAEVDQTNGRVIKWKFTILGDQDRRDAAKAAAPYFAPKISQVELIGGLNDEQLASIIAGAAAEAKISVSFDRAGETSETRVGQATDSLERRKAKSAPDVP
jgi:hypothetical protein